MTERTSAIDVRASVQGRVRRVCRHPVWSCILLLTIYAAVALLMDDAGYLGTDTGGKVATLTVMDANNTFDPGVGYWALTADPDASLHPLYFTTSYGDKLVNVTTLPMLVAGRPLWSLGGYKAILLLPMLGAVAAAAAGRALARLVTGGGSDGTRSFWVIGLASPMFVYALDFWEHSIGVGFMAWGVVAGITCLEVQQVRYAVLMGAAFGAAGTMRTEAFADVTVMTGCLLVVLLVVKRMNAGRVLVLGGSAVLGFLLPTGLNALLEYSTIGVAIRFERTAAVASIGGSQGDRLGEALLTGLGARPSMATDTYIQGAMLLIILALAIHLGAGDRRHRSSGLPLDRIALIPVVAFYAMRFLDGWGFVPGLIPTTPLAVVALMRFKHLSDAGRLVVVVALGCLPVVWWFQFAGGAGPQWAGRYILLTGTLLLAVGCTQVDKLLRPTRVVLVGVSVAVTLFGVGWLYVRSHAYGDAFRELRDRPEAVVVSNENFFLREGGAFYLDRQWLTADKCPEVKEADCDLDELGAVLRQMDIEDIAFVSYERRTYDEEEQRFVPAEPPQIPGFATIREEQLDFLDGLDLTLWTFESIAAPVP